MPNMGRDAQTDASPTGPGMGREEYMYTIGEVVDPATVTLRKNNITPSNLEEEAARDRAVRGWSVGTRD